MGKKENKYDNIEIKVSDEDDMDNNANDDGVIQNDSSEAPTNMKSENNHLEQLQRLQAEFINYKKRIEREKLEFSDYCKGELISELLPVLDDFDRLLQHSNSSPTNFARNEALNGVQLIYRNLLEILIKEGLNPIDAVGKKFDPTIHEALLIDPASEGDHEIVAEEWKKGYLFKGRLLRPAQVKVAKIENAAEN